MMLKTLLETIYNIRCKVVYISDITFEQVIVYQGFENEILDKMEKEDNDYWYQIVYQIDLSDDGLLITLDM